MTRRRKSRAPHTPSARRPRPLRLDPLEGRDVPAAGALDLTFGADGILTTPTGAAGADVAVQPDGKVVVAAGTVNAGQSDFGVVRYNADGSLDTSFGVSGVATANILPFDTAFALALEPDGKIVVAGWGSATVSQDDTDIALARFNPDGSLDRSFGTNGRVSTDFGPGSQLAAAVVVQPDGRIVVAGSTGKPAGLTDFALVRYTADGALDPTFGGDGRVTTDFGFGSDSAAGLALQPDGKIVAAGMAFDGRTDLGALARYLPDGSLDPTFGHGGTVTTPVGAGPTTLNGVAVLPDGRIVAGGLTGRPAGNQNEFVLARYLPDGTLDPAFGGGRPVTTEVGIGELGKGLAVQPDGKVVLTGSSAAAFETLDFTVLRYDPDGSLDATFGQGGVVTTDISHRTTDFAFGAAVQADGRILVAGYANGGPGNGPEVALVRYRPDGSLDRLSDGTGKVITPVGPGDDTAAAVTVQADGKVVVVGRTFNGANDDMGVVRYDRDGSLDPAFGSGGEVRYDLCGDADAAGAVAVQADGKVVVAGVTRYLGLEDFALLRLLADGSPDSGFGGGAVHRLYAADGAVTSLILQPDGKAVVAGWGLAFNGSDNDFILIRVDATGADDPTFHGGRAVFTPVGSGDDSVLALALQADGKIVAVGRARDGSGNDIALVRYLPDGSLDPAFGTGGKVMTDFGGDEIGSAVAIQADGRIVVGGQADGEFIVVRYRPDGSLDPAFGAGGRVAADFGPAAAGATGVSVQADGKIVASGTSGGSFALARFNTDGTPDPTFAVSGKEVIPVGVSGGKAVGMAVGPDGRIVVAGSANNGSNDDFAVVRVRGDNRAPVAVPTTLTTAEDTPLVVTSPTYFYDPDGDAATTELLSAPAHGTLDLTPYGTFTYTPDPDFNGTDRFAYKVADAFGGFNVGSVDLVVTPVAEAVEVRADPALPGKVSLFVRGTDGDDAIAVRPVGTSRSSYVVIRNGTAETATGVTGRVYVDGLGGNDSIRVPAVRVPAVLDGGAGIDTLVAGVGNDSLTGGPGDDVLDGGPGVDRVVESGDVDYFLESGPAGGDGTLAGGLGTDRLVRNRIEEAELTGGASNNRIDAMRFRGRTWLRGLGGDDYLVAGAAASVILGGEGADRMIGSNGRDVLIGGLGQDVIGGDAGDDLVIGGGTVFDGNPGALAAIRAEWLSGSSYATRVGHLRGTLAGGRNGGFVLDPTTVFDEAGTPYLLTGGTGRDFFIIHPGDLTDRVDPEQVLTV